ncbi:MAG: hypothetical protein ACI379_16250 [Nocardioides sp.]|uniref:hypothetical protein n=1 Tax=Nocardioides sp. TaxID=35761 RepID=UPI003F04B33B
MAAPGPPAHSSTAAALVPTTQPTLLNDVVGKPFLVGLPEWSEVPDHVEVSLSLTDGHVSSAIVDGTSNSVSLPSDGVADLAYGKVRLYAYKDGYDRGYADVWLQARAFRLLRFADVTGTGIVGEELRVVPGTHVTKPDSVVHEWLVGHQLESARVVTSGPAFRPLHPHAAKRVWLRSTATFGTSRVVDLRHALRLVRGRSSLTASARRVGPEVVVRFRLTVPSVNHPKGRVRILSGGERLTSVGAVRAPLERVLRVPFRRGMKEITVAYTGSFRTAAVRRTVPIR